jgi:hypothetical protein
VPRRRSLGVVTDAGDAQRREELRVEIWALAPTRSRVIHVVLELAEQRVEQPARDGDGSEVDAAEQGVAVALQKAAIGQRLHLGQRPSWDERGHLTARVHAHPVLVASLVVVHPTQRHEANDVRAVEQGVGTG